MKYQIWFHYLSVRIRYMSYIRTKKCPILKKKRGG